MDIIDGNVGGVKGRGHIHFVINFGNAINVQRTPTTRRRSRRTPKGIPVMLLLLLLL